MIRPYCLFDLADDPGEKFDLTPQNRKTEKRLQATLERLLSMRPSLNSKATALDDRTNERLRALGYIE